MRLVSRFGALCFPALALAAAAACAHPHLAEAPLAARSVDAARQPRLDAEAKVAASHQFLHRGHIENGVFASDALGVSAEIQSDFAALIPQDGAELELKRRGWIGRHPTAALAGAIHFLFDPLSTELEARMTETIARSLRRDADGAVRARASYAIQLAAGVADVYEVDLEDSAQVKIAYVSACGGAATLVLVGAWEGPQGDTATEGWFDRVRLDDRAPACAFIAAHAAHAAHAAGAAPAPTTGASAGTPPGE